MSIELHDPPSGLVGGALRWLGETLRVVGAAVPVRTEWVEEVVPGPWMGRSLNFRIPEVSEGRYALVLTAMVPGREPVVAVREIEVTRSTLSAPSLGRMVRRPELTRPTRCIPEVTFGESAFLIPDFRHYVRTPLCFHRPDPSWFGHYGGSDHLSDYGYNGW